MGGELKFKPLLFSNLISFRYICVEFSLGVFRA
jgi:hypothetical protein